MFYGLIFDIFPFRFSAGAKLRHYAFICSLPGAIFLRLSQWSGGYGFRLADRAEQRLVTLDIVAQGGQQFFGIHRGKDHPGHDAGFGNPGHQGEIIHDEFTLRVVDYRQVGIYALCMCIGEFDVDFSCRIFCLFHRLLCVGMSRFDKRV